MSGPELLVVALPIGDPRDITVRARQVLESVDLIICEELKPALRLLKRLDIKKPLELLNEHNEEDKSRELLFFLLQNRIKAALVADAGTPGFADPGSKLVDLCQQNGIRVTPVPGACSLTAALMVSGVKLDNFLYRGFLSANKETRISQLKGLPRNIDIVLLDAPYRLQPLLSDMIKILGYNRQAVLAYKLTCPGEKVITGSISDLQKISADWDKGEFVIILKKAEDRQRK
ncbi:MAG: 16S rRNA (cytidine(1402)-2'-O)-methyltransferase [Candidatus Cloacimonetes bacterium]|nr:16S rRNA (cytidine(1402)-2'-O)-methyltransferase [Candidatus Cloacimonadota bacterium]